MSFKEDLLRKLNVSKLKQLAEENKISLVRENWGEKYILKSKDDIVEALLDSKKLSEKKIKEFTEPKKNFIRKPIPKAVKISVWNRDIGPSKTEGKCYVCGERTIHITVFYCGHVIAVVNGGTDSLDNLRPVCRPCNSSMHDMNLEEFKKQYGYNKNRQTHKKDNEENIFGESIDSKLLSNPDFLKQVYSMSKNLPRSLDGSNQKKVKKRRT